MNAPGAEQKRTVHGPRAASNGPSARSACGKSGKSGVFLFLHADSYHKSPKTMGKSKMGTPRLRIKTELNYRRGYTSRSCNHCNHLVTVPSEKHLEYRCTIIGVKPGRLYRINPNNICDAHDNSRYLKRLKGGMT